MKILIINDYLFYGGAEMQSRREKATLEKNGHEAYLLTFDNNFPYGEIYNENNGFYNIRVVNSGIQSFYRKLFCDYVLLGKIKKIINNINPDFIHVNNLYVAPIAQYKALEGYKVIQTIRDYSAVCPINTCIYNNKNICKGTKYNDCMKECGTNKFEMNIRLRKFKKIYELRKKYITKFVCPSEMLTDYCSDHGFDIKCINNPFDTSRLEHFTKKISKASKKYLFFGNVDENKGIFKFIEIFNEFSKDKNVELLIAGKLLDKDKDTFQGLLDKNNKIKYLGLLKYDKVLELLSEVYSVVVPSLWMENYPNTVLEGMATKCLVLASDRGGMPGMLADGRGIIFDIMNKKNVLKALDKSYDMSNIEYDEITEKAQHYVINNNSIEKYYFRIMDLFKAL